MSDIMQGAEMAAESTEETCPDCGKSIELVTRNAGRGMLKAHLGKLAIVCEGSWGPSLEFRRTL